FFIALRSFCFSSSGRICVYGYTFMNSFVFVRQIIIILIILVEVFQSYLIKGKLYFSPNIFNRYTAKICNCSKMDRQRKRELQRKKKFSFLAAFQRRLQDFLCFVYKKIPG